MKTKRICDNCKCEFKFDTKNIGIEKVNKKKREVLLNNGKSYVDNNCFFDTIHVYILDFNIVTQKGEIKYINCPICDKYNVLKDTVEYETNTSYSKEIKGDYFDVEALSRSGIWREVVE